MSIFLNKIAISIGVLLGGGGFIVYSAIGRAQHYMMVDELLQQGDLASWQGKELKVHGNVVAGSIHEQVIGQEMRRTFVLVSKGKTIRVFSTGPKPDTFKDDSEVVATGDLVAMADAKDEAAALDTHLESNAPYVFEATDLTAKCPSKYDGATSNKNINTVDTTKFQ